MYIAMNRFQIVRGQEETFEQMWRKRDTYLYEVPGFREFHLLRGQSEDAYTLYASHSIWDSREAFEGWTKSESFRKAHAHAGRAKGVYVDHPRFEGFEVILRQGGTA